MQYTMSQLLKDQWVDALLSGQYTQGVGTSYNYLTKQFCVVGVLMDIIAHEYPTVLRWSPVTTWWISDTYPSPFKAIVSLQLDMALLGDLILMNDIDQMSFTDLAHWIDEHVEGV